MYASYSTSTSSSRTSTSSTNTNSSGYNGNQKSLAPGDVPTLVHNLLSSTKQLQEMLRQWSLNQATESQVSDVYVQVGTEFNAIIGAFAYHQIDLSDIHSIPQELRTVLENCLAQEPSSEVFQSFAPEVKKIFYKLLKGLQSRQAAWRAVVNREAP
ncbi:uncharacterized protein LACBIDRAFT_303602 [Laccaria bicolor S238N-H82]|uniref:Predicted protein n=1 Tax=Laccaria bicolor (strain S238N-H82 / ATCC MYA-4686) TaxID=486041 RepID=B0DJU2_LACBS|nr:uncharacterized protein LACBIDRAFT_303602 [Laccaria bicolor S238N-H82]EDR05178.1 predicted protein [Laccaria bicolor S238N-H82]|eukprot:XP_001884143.1 predicted protein [Laccaria bicolor S238N-H82]